MGYPAASHATGRGYPYYLVVNGPPQGAGAEPGSTISPSETGWSGVVVMSAGGLDGNSGNGAGVLARGTDVASGTTTCVETGALVGS